MATEPLLVTKKLAAEMLTTSERTIQNMTKRGEIPSVLIGARGRRYSVEALKKFVEKQLKQAEQQA